MAMSRVTPRDEGDRLLTVHEVADLLAVSVQTIHGWRYKGMSSPPAVRLGGALRWRREDVERWVAEHAGTPEPTPAPVRGGRPADRSEHDLWRSGGTGRHTERRPGSRKSRRIVTPTSGRLVHARADRMLKRLEHSPPRSYSNHLQATMPQPSTRSSGHTASFCRSAAANDRAPTSSPSTHEPGRSNTNSASTRLPGMPNGRGPVRRRCPLAARPVVLCTLRW